MLQLACCMKLETVAKALFRIMISVPHLIEIHRLYLFKFTAALIRFHYYR